MNETEILQALARFRYKTDEREPPDNLRRGQFRAGWGDKIERKQDYSDKTLDALTWHNAGWRMAEVFGSRQAGEIDWAFDVLAKRYGGAESG